MISYFKDERGLLPGDEFVRSSQHLSLEPLDIDLDDIHLRATRISVPVIQARHVDRETSRSVFWARHL